MTVAVARISEAAWKVFKSSMDCKLSCNAPKEMVLILPLVVAVPILKRAIAFT
jgi:hypothetical protein